MTNLSPRSLVVVLLLWADVVSSFSSSSSLKFKKALHTGYKNDDLAFRLMAKMDDEERNSFFPETSFGADAVPEGQRPVNEYLDLLRQPLFGWCTEDVGDKGFATRLVALFAIVFFMVCYPISGATYTQDGFEFQKIASSNFGAVTLVGVLLIRLYSGWGYVAERLQNKMVEYEETGWYDGDFEEKTEEEKRRDKFLFLSDVKPVIDRLRAFGLATGGIWVASFIMLNVATSENPVFNEYDPQMIERLSYDEKLADTAAEQSGGRPTYCDNRYYRARAGGGQGC